MLYAGLCCSRSQCIHGQAGMLFVYRLRTVPDYSGCFRMGGYRRMNDIAKDVARMVGIGSGCAGYAVRAYVWESIDGLLMAWWMVFTAGTISSLSLFCNYNQ